MHPSWILIFDPTCLPLPFLFTLSVTHASDRFAFPIKASPHSSQLFSMAEDTASTPPDRDASNPVTAYAPPFPHRLPLPSSPSPSLFPSTPLPSPPSPPSHPTLTPLPHTQVLRRHQHHPHPPPPHLLRLRSNLPPHPPPSHHPLENKATPTFPPVSAGVYPCHPGTAGG